MGEFRIHFPGNVMMVATSSRASNCSLEPWRILHCRRRSFECPEDEYEFVIEFMKTWLGNNLNGTEYTTALARVEPTLLLR